MNAIVLGHPEAHEKLTARLFWKLTSERGYLDAGNVRDYNIATTRTLVTRPKVTRGVRFVQAEQADVDHQSFSFLLDERVPEQERLIHLAKQLENSKQKSVEGATATISSVVTGRWFYIGAYNVGNITVTSSKGGSQEEGVDYEVDRRNGRIRILKDAGISDGEDVNVTFDQPGIEFERVETHVEPLFYCDVVIEEFNQFHDMWLRRMSFKAYLNVMEWPQQTGEFGTYRVKVTPAESITVLKRPEAETLPSVTEGDGPAKSSSSSSTSSSSSERSISSSSSSSSYSTLSSSSSSSSTFGLLSTDSTMSSSSSSSKSSQSSSSSSSYSTLSSSSSVLSESSSTSLSSSSSGHSSSSSTSVSSSSSSSTFASETSSSSRGFDTSSTSVSSSSSSSP